MDIPDWELHVIPPVRPVPPEEQDRPENRSPYEATLLQLVERFATTPERVKLLHDLMDYRQDLYAVGVTEGFQWINGSFVEEVEARDRRGKEPKPYDIDVVTFYHQPDGQPNEIHDLFRPSTVRARYDIDAFNLVMGTPTTNHIVESVAYWYGMWSTRREDQTPKGFVQVNLDPEHDPEARQALSEIQL